MSRQTWLMMVQVATKKLPRVTRRRRKNVTAKQAPRSVREDHYALLVAAGY